MRRLLDAPGLQGRTEEFLTAAPQFLGAGDGAVYVAQQESAVVYGGGPAKWVGSAEATTCVIAVLRGEIEGGMIAVLCMHVDLQTENQPHHFVLDAATLFGSGTGIDLYLLGGYRDDGPLDKWVSWPILAELVAALHAAELVSRVRLAAVHTLNTMMKNMQVSSIPAKIRRRLSGELSAIDVPFPRQYGLAVCLATGDVRPTEFLDRGAALILRSLVWCGDSPAFEPYQPATDTYEFVAPAGGLQMPPVEFCRRVLAMEDEEMLGTFSTSPLVEPSNFCEDCRAKFRFILSMWEDTATPKPWLEALMAGKRLIFRRRQRLSTSDTSSDSLQIGDGWEFNFDENQER